MSIGAIHMGRVAELGCYICKMNGYGSTPAQVHHIREGQGASQRANDLLTVPLCPVHHTGRMGIHGMGRTAFERMYKVTELDMLADTIELLMYTNAPSSKGRPQPVGDRGGAAQGGSLGTGALGGGSGMPGSTGGLPPEDLPAGSEGLDAAAQQAQADR